MSGRRAPTSRSRKAITAGLRDAMDADDKVLLMGEDIGVLGGVFRVTDGLHAEFGSQRVVDTPLAEAGIVGTSVGLAVRGYRPVVEIQFDGFVFPAFNQITTQVAKMHNRTARAVHMPIVIRIPHGGGIGAIEHHSESPGGAVRAHRGPADPGPLERAGRLLDDPPGDRVRGSRHPLRAEEAVLGQGGRRPRSPPRALPLAGCRWCARGPMRPCWPGVRACPSRSRARRPPPRRASTSRSSTPARCPPSTIRRSSPRCSAPGAC